MASGEQLVTPPRVWFWDAYDAKWSEVFWDGYMAARHVENHIELCRSPQSNRRRGERVGFAKVPTCVAIEKGWRDVHFRTRRVSHETHRA